MTELLHILEYLQDIQRGFRNVRTTVGWSENDKDILKQIEDSAVDVIKEIR